MLNMLSYTSEPATSSAELKTAVPSDGHLRLAPEDFHVKIPNFTTLKAFLAPDQIIELDLNWVLLVLLHKFMHAIG